MKKYITGKCLRHPVRFTAAYYALYMLIFAYVEKHCTGSDVHIIHSSLDQYIPFCKYAFIPYVLWFAFIGFSIVWFLFKGKKEEFWRVTITLFLGMIGTAVFYILVKTGLDIRPSYVEGNDIFAKAVRLIWSMDTPTNVCPSIHVLITVGIDRCWSCSETIEEHPVCRWLIHLLSVSIILSTLLLKQHSVIDASTGILVGFAVYRIASYISSQNVRPEYYRKKAKKQIHAL